MDFPVERGPKKRGPALRVAHEIRDTVIGVGRMQFGPAVPFVLAAYGAYQWMKETGGVFDLTAGWEEVVSAHRSANENQPVRIPKEKIVARFLSQGMDVWEESEYANETWAGRVSNYAMAVPTLLGGLVGLGLGMKYARSDE